MCLHVIIKKIETPTDKEYKAWKVFTEPKHTTIADVKFISPCVMGTKLKLDKWQKARKVKITDDRMNPYLSGFHVFTSRARAIKYATDITDVVLPVTVRKVRTRGMADWSPDFKSQSDCLVADEIFIKSEDLEKFYFKPLCAYQK